MDWTDYPPGEPLRGVVRAAIEEATGEALPVNDPLPDELIAAAQIGGIPLGRLQIWIYYRDRGSRWSAGSFMAWARELEREAAELRARVN